MFIRTSSVLWCSLIVKVKVGKTEQTELLCAMNYKQLATLDSKWMDRSNCKSEHADHFYILKYSFWMVHIRK